MGTLSGWFGARLARYLSTDVHQQGSAPPTRTARLLATLQPGDVLLVEGHSRFSTAIKYLTQSTWSHAALYVGTEALQGTGAPVGHCFVEADVVEGVRSVAADLFESYHTRICRPIGLTAPDTALIVGYAVARLGHRYDLRNVWDLARYLLPTPPVPQRFRRRMLSLGSGDPTRAICSTLIAQAFQSIRYPILPRVDTQSRDAPDCPGCIEEILRVRHHSLFAPRDFDVSPYFDIIKPTLRQGFDFHGVQWGDLTFTAVTVRVALTTQESDQ
ncbi:YiiX/YebB-like N1pC/P60 family cysteine hydrolase [Polaromonas sp.]|uniref:YiiX/YebB-like N1pC/P60 family cysteine hydrolase n=1 Tax=Polaromonas sp. TaxID=1869339 RepID=UPI003561BFE5